MITEDYVSFETAKLLKEKGFDGICYHAYSFKNGNNKLIGASLVIEGSVVITAKDTNIAADYYKEEFGFDIEFYLAPTINMAIKWLREVHNQIIIIKYGNAGFVEESILQWWWELLNTKGELHACNIVDGNKSYEEACEDSILYVLKNLI